MPFFYFDYWYIVLVVPALILSIIIQSKMKSTYRKYSAIRTGAGVSGAEMARRVLAAQGVFGVSVTEVDGELTDHYDPKAKVIRLSKAVYEGNSISSVGVACHEAGHAVQHAQGYFPLVLRNTIVPAVNFCSGISWFVVLLGIFLGHEILINLGIILFASAAIFQFITLPVELNASKRAVDAIKNERSLTESEVKGTQKVLFAAAMTYVAALVTSLASLLRLILITKGNRRR